MGHLKMLLVTGYVLLLQFNFTNVAQLYSFDLSVHKMGLVSRL